MVNFKIFNTFGNYDVEVEKSVRAKRFPQYAAAFTASIAAFAAGTVIAWTSPASLHLLNGGAGFPIDEAELSMVGSLMPIGAAVFCVPAGYSLQKIGRKATLLALLPISLIGWSLIVWPSGVEMIYAGRFVCGMFVGAACVASPVFTAEIAQKEIRGELTSYFQLFLSAGIVLTYAAGSLCNVFSLSIACGVVPILYAAALLFFPDTPIYYVMTKRRKNAERSLKFFRGADFDVEPELREMVESCERLRNGNDESAWDVFISKRGIRALFISIGLMMFQQLNGVNAITFYTTLIFKDSGSSLEPKYATIIVGFMQFTGSLLSMFLVDRLGRIVLLGASATMMASSTLLLGVYFHLKGNEFDMDNFSWLPLLSLCVFSVMFSVGYGPLPYVIVPEITPSRIIGMVTSISCVLNWTCAFLVTKFFSDLVSSFGSDVTFWIFSAISTIGTIFSLTALPETKGKSLKDIQIEMNS